VREEINGSPAPNAGRALNYGWRLMEGFLEELPIPALSGTHFYADYCAGFVRSSRYQNGQSTAQTESSLLNPSGNLVTSYGEDAAGELYVVTQGGSLFKFVPN
jgi:hypothetical protein